MTRKNRKRVMTCLGAFVFGVVLMVGVYGLFQATGSRYRTGSTDTGAADIVLTAAEDGADRAPSAFLGVEVLSIRPLLVEQLNLPPGGGVLVNNVVSESPAATAGLMRGDVIVSLNKFAVEDVDAFREVMLELKPADTVRIVYVRDGGKDSVYAELAAAATQTTASVDPGDSGWGISLSDLTSTLRATLGIPDDITGVVILSVVPGSSADQANLSAGDVIMGIDKMPISNLGEFFSALAADNDNTALLDVYSQGRMSYVPMDSFADVRLTGGTPFSTDDDDDEEGPKGGKFARDDVTLTSDNTAFNRPSAVPGDTNTGGSTGSSSTTTGMNRPSAVPPQLSGSTNDTVLFVGLLLLVILYLAYREYHRPMEAGKGR